MEEQIKNIISRYTKIPVEHIGVSTIIDRSAVTGSILLHRMYASLATEGFIIDNYWDVKNYGALLQRINKTAPGIELIPETDDDIDNTGTQQNESLFKGIGIDIEEITAMPLVNDYREDEFYKMNFDPAEIAYCILQPGIQASFAGLFAAKEAIVKANNRYKNKPFNTIFIDHLPGGKPVHSEFQLSIAHTDTTVVAVAVTINATIPTLQNTSLDDLQNGSKFSLTFWFALFAFLLSILSLVLLYKR